ncbi:Transcriptional regulatory protein YpdB [Emticicia aquatica]|jgi:DNA-binding LytR/AlgR family response regulator|uniref:Transcriptional regulatory protein YpdB n=1 Tax=Emticicia aquatica TaxID=1681835 RepID=A0ABM9AQJ3_9BACT|nr:LytTR family DNA-binding domain-containing protein [Emticicia aquatica]CAH0995974.1 Transcriptional regulatory protein YpdB [Emticicia aquatica]
MKLKCIIVEDEIMARMSLQRLCEQHESLTLVDIFENAEDALEFLSKEVIDLIWLDVEMPGLSGFDLLKNLYSMPQVIMTTSKVEYAFEAYQYQVTDYIQKPITQPRFKIAVEKVLELNTRKTTASPERHEIYVKTDGRYIRLPYSEILYIENVGDYVKIFAKKHSYIVHTTMKYLEEKLGDSFLRVHRSYIVHLDKIVDIEENTLVIENKVIPISRANKPELLNKLNML